MKVKFALFNIDTACVEIYFDDENFTILSFYTPDIEDSLHTTPYTLSQLELLAETNPIEYAELILTGKMQDYLDLIAEGNRDTSRTIRKQLERHYPDMSDVQIESLVREYAMYDGNVENPLMYMIIFFYHLDERKPLTLVILTKTVRAR